MNTDDWFFNKLVELQSDYRRIDKTNREMLAASYEGRAKDKENHEEMIRNLCRALERAQEIIIDIGEKSGNAELLKDAKIYANAIGDVAHGLGPEPYPDYSKNPMVKYHWSNVNRDGSPKGKKPSKRQRRAK